MEDDRSMVEAPERGVTQATRAALSAYNREIVSTDKLPPGEVEPALFGLFGEVGSVLTVVKKRGRDGSAFRGWDRLFAEELADVLWYFATVSRRLGVDLDQLFVDGSLVPVNSPAPVESVAADRQTGALLDDETNVQLGEAAAALLRVRTLDGAAWERLRTFGSSYMRVLEASGLTLEEIMGVGIRKAHEGFVLPASSSLPRFDGGFPEGERLPEHFEITFTQRTDGRCEMVWDGEAVGDPLNDAIVSPDGFRFHDVFHLAHVAVLHWSPTFRALAGRKRKSVPKVDDTEDGARARVVEEGIVAWIFGRAKEMDFFEGQQLVAFDLLKTVAQFVRGFEVERCPLRLWEKAILVGYEVFRQVRTNEGGIVIGNRRERTLKYVEHK